jgi:hypothetical protein
MFQLTDEEVEIMVSQNAIPSRQHLGGSLPYAFTEHGILQLSNVLKSGRAVNVSIHIINVFVKMREMLITHKDILLELEELRKRSDSQDDRIEIIYTYLRKFINTKQDSRTKMGYKK